MKCINLKTIFGVVIVTSLAFPRVSYSTITSGPRGTTARSTTSTLAVVGGILVVDGTVCRFPLGPLTVPFGVRVVSQARPWAPPGITQCGAAEMQLVSSISSQATPDNLQVAALDVVIFLGVACIAAGVLGAVYEASNELYKATWPYEYSEPHFLMKWLVHPITYGLAGIIPTIIAEIPIAGAAVGLVCGFSGAEAVKAAVFYYTKKDSGDLGDPGDLGD